MCIAFAYDIGRVVRVSGEIDPDNVEELGTVLSRAVEAYQGVFTIDLSDVTYLDSAGIRAILHAYQQSREAGGRIALVVANDSLKRLLHIVRLDELPDLFICDDLPSARAVLAADARRSMRKEIN
ncbi:MAG: STAS domain-containing protein [Armatimonadota bacterium]